MFLHRALLGGVVLSAAVMPVRAGDCCGGSAPIAAPAPVIASDSCGSPSCAPACAPAPAMRTISVTEWVSEQYETFRTVCKTEYVNETYTAYRTECVPETRTKCVTINRMVPECRDEVRTTYKCVPTVE